MTAGHRRHRGALRTRLLNNPQLLFDRVPHPRPSPPAQRISRDDLFSEDAHLTPTWTPTMCPLSPSWVHRAPPAMRPKPDGYCHLGKQAETNLRPTVSELRLDQSWSSIKAAISMGCDKSTC